MTFKELVTRFRLGFTSVIIISLFLLIGLLIVRSPTPFGFSSKKTKAKTIMTLPAEQILYREKYEFSREFVGKVEARQQSVLGFELSGTLSSIPVEEGDAVKKGQILAELDPKKLKANLKEAEATLKRSKAEFDLAKNTLKRNEEAQAVNAVSKQDLDVAKEGMESSEAAVSMNQARVETIEVDLEKSIMKAPYNGIVIKRFVDEGVVVSPGEKILEVQQAGALNIRVGVTTEVAKSLIVGQDYPVWIHGNKIHAVVYAILPVTGDSRTVNVILKIDKPDQEIRPGDLARFTVQDSITKRGFWVPISSLSEGRRGLWTVYAVIPTKDDPSLYRVERRHVELFHLKPEKAYVSGSVDDGEWIISDGTHKLVNGLTIRVSKDKAGYE